MDKLYAILPKKIGTIAPETYGVFAEHIGGVFYDGIYCGKDAEAENIRGFRKFLIDKVKEANIPVIRWPGGCFAETYNWRDGIGPVENRPVRLNWWTPFDGRYEPNLVGTDEFMDFCTLCGAQPYFAANITSTTPLDIREWVDYCNSPEGTTTLARLRGENGHAAPYDIRLWGVGNETWGGGGNMTPESYAIEYRKYAELMFNAAPHMELIVSGANADDYNWTRDMMRVLTQNDAHISGMSFHYYCFCTDDPVGFTDDGWYTLLGKANRMQELIDRHWGTIVSYGLENKAKLCIDEWGAWHCGGSGPSNGYNLFEQQSTMRDAALTALTLNIFNNNAEKIRLCTVAQLVNNLHALFLARGKDCVVTPTYHVFSMYKTHQGGQAIETAANAAACPNGLCSISSSASVKDGVLTVTAANLSADEDKEVSLELLGGIMGKKAEITLLAADDLRAHNTFGDPACVTPVTRTVEAFDGRIDLPHGGIVTVRAAVE